METFKIEVGAGKEFSHFATQAKHIAGKRDITVEYEFNGVTCLVNKSTDVKLLHRDYSNSWTMGWKTVGPDCVPIYPKKVAKELKKKTQERDEKSRIATVVYEAKQAKEEQEFEETTKGVEMEFSDPDGWKKSREVNTDGYGKAVLDYAEGWAKLMQIEIAKGKTIAECYEPTQHGVSFYGITGFQFGCAASIIAQAWKHGEEFRRVHNKEYVITGDEKGTVNPAIFTIK